MGGLLKCPDCGPGGDAVELNLENAERSRTGPIPDPDPGRLPSNTVTPPALTLEQQINAVRGNSTGHGKVSF